MDRVSFLLFRIRFLCSFLWPLSRFLTGFLYCSSFLQRSFCFSTSISPTPFLLPSFYIGVSCQVVLFPHFHNGARIPPLYPFIRFYPFFLGCLFPYHF